MVMIIKTTVKCMVFVIILEIMLEIIGRNFGNGTGYSDKSVHLRGNGKIENILIMVNQVDFRIWMPTFSFKAVNGGGKCWGYTYVMWIINLVTNCIN